MGLLQEGQVETLASRGQLMRAASRPFSHLLASRCVGMPALDLGRAPDWESLYSACHSLGVKQRRLKWPPLACGGHCLMKERHERDPMERRG